MRKNSFREINVFIQAFYISQLETIIVCRQSSEWFLFCFLSRKNISNGIVKRESKRQKERKDKKKKKALSVEQRREGNEDVENHQARNGISKKPIKNGGKKLQIICRTNFTFLICKN